MMKAQSNHAILFSLLPVCAYIGVRYLIYGMLPASSITQWFIRDCIMTIPRLLAFGALLFVNRKFDGLVPFDFGLSRNSGTMFWVSSLIVIYVVSFVLRGWYPWLANGELIIVLLTSIVVGVFEEYAFRGMILGHLLRRVPTIAAVLLSSLLFTIYHWQAQPLNTWFGIFFTGIAFAIARLQGVSLFWLALAHGIIDWGFFFFDSQFNLTSELVLVTGLCILSLVGIFKQKSVGQLAEA